MDLSYYKKYEPINGKWNIVKELGKGAYGTVLEVERNDVTKVRSALKIITIPSSDGDVTSFKRDNFSFDDKSVTSYFYGMVEEFINEIQLMSQLKGYKNIVAYEDHDVKKHEGKIGWDIFIRMELLTPLGEYYSKNRPEESDVIKLGIDICKALEACGSLNIIHRDIKPSNIFVSKEGDYKLGDFGVARTLERAAAGMSKKGTYTYMAPEIYNGGAYSSNVDLYSLGMVMYRLMNNNLEPFRASRTYADGERALSIRMNNSAPIKPPANAGKMFSQVILKACSYSPADRYRSAEEMRRDLEIVLNGDDGYGEDDLDRTVCVYDKLGMEELRREAERLSSGGISGSGDSGGKGARAGKIRFGKTDSSGSSTSETPTPKRTPGRFFKRTSEKKDLSDKRVLLDKRDLSDKPSSSEKKSADPDAKSGGGTSKSLRKTFRKPSTT